MIAFLLAASLSAAASPAAPEASPAPAAETSADADADKDDSGEPEPARKLDADTESFGDSNGQAFDIRTMAQLRYTETWVPTANLIKAGDPDPRAGDLYIDGTVAAGDVQVLRNQQLQTLLNDDGYAVHRLFLRMEASPSKKVKTKLLVDFAELLHNSPVRALKQAFVEYKPKKGILFAAGYFKRRFSLLELMPIADFELAEAGPTDTLVKDLGYAGRDVGAMIGVQPFKPRRRLALFLAIFGGDVTAGYDAHLGQLINGRVESEVIDDHLVVGADFAWRPYDNHKYIFFKALDADKGGRNAQFIERGKGTAASADVSALFGAFKLQFEGMFGKRTDNLYAYNCALFDEVRALPDDRLSRDEKQLLEKDLPLRERTRDPGTTFYAVWALAAYRMPIGKMTLIPALRAEYLDVSKDIAGSGGRFYGSAALNLELTRNLRATIDLSRYEPQAHSRNFSDVPSLKADEDVGPDYFGWDAPWTQLIFQLQYRV